MHVAHSLLFPDVTHCNGSVSPLRSGPFRRPARSSFSHNVTTSQHPGCSPSDNHSRLHQVTVYSMRSVCVVACSSLRETQPHLNPRLFPLPPRPLHALTSPYQVLPALLRSISNRINSNSNLIYHALPFSLINLQNLVISHLPKYQTFVTITDRLCSATVLAVKVVHCNIRNFRDKTELAHLHVFTRHRLILT